MMLPMTGAAYREDDGRARSDLRPGQMWQGTYAPKYHIIAIYGDAVWTLMHMPGVSAERQRTTPENRTRAFFDGMRCLYDPTQTAEMFLRQRDEALAEVERLRYALREFDGSYNALVANLEGLARSAPYSDGPTLARQVLDSTEPNTGEREASS